MTGVRARLLAAILCGSLAATAAATEPDDFTVEAGAVVMRLQAGLLRIDREQSGRPMSVRVAAFAPLIEETHDLNYMGQLTLGRVWAGLSAGQQQHFLALFRQLSEQDYARRFRDTAGAHFELVRVAAAPGSRAQVDTLLHAPGEAPVALQYVLQKGSAGWRIVNILAQGVSDLALQRTQYQQILTQAGFDALVAHLRRRIEEMS